MPLCSPPLVAAVLVPAIEEGRTPDLICSRGSTGARPELGSVAFPARLAPAPDSGGKGVWWARGDDAAEDAEEPSSLST